MTFIQLKSKGDNLASGYVMINHIIDWSQNSKGGTLVHLSDGTELVTHETPHEFAERIKHGL